MCLLPYRDVRDTRTGVSTGRATHQRSSRTWGRRGPAQTCIVRRVCSIDPVLSLIHRVDRCPRLRGWPKGRHWGWPTLRVPLQRRARPSRLSLADITAQQIQGTLAAGRALLSRDHVLNKPRGVVVHQPHWLVGYYANTVKYDATLDSLFQRLNLVAVPKISGQSSPRFLDISSGEVRGDQVAPFQSSLAHRVETR